MSKIKAVRKIMTDKVFRMDLLSDRGFYRDMSDEEYLKKRFKAFKGYELDLVHPKTYCEKLQWLKLYDRKPEYVTMVDKYAVKEYVSSRVGEEHVIPLLGVWDSFDEINFDKLPNQFVLKVTHNSGGSAVCKDKNTFDKDSAKENLQKWLGRNYFWGGREWPYKHVKPRIIAEEYIPSLGNPDSIEYKSTCFGGKVGFITICIGPAHVELWKRTNDSYTTDFQHMPWWAYYKNAKVEPEKPEQWEELIELSEKLSAGIPEVRVDFYIINGKVYFGEFTFYTWSGFLHFQPDEWDRKLGDMIVLPEKQI